MENKRCITCSMEYPDHKMSCKNLVKEYRLPTAYEWLKRDESGVYSEMDICQAMVTFAKLHVEHALKEASKEALVEDKDGDSAQYMGYSNGIDEYSFTCNKASIINSYPLENIK